MRKYFQFYPYKIALSVLLFSLVGCLPEPIDVKDVPRAPDGIVVSSVLIPDQGLSMVLSYNFSALERNLGSDSSLFVSLLVQDAKVEVSSTDLEVSVLPLEAGIYASNDLLQVVENEYTLTIVDENTGLEASASSKLRTPVAFNSVEVQYENREEEVVPHVAYSFNNVAGKGYYVINAQKILSLSSTLDDLINTKTFTYLIETEPDQHLVEGDFSVLFGNEFEIGDTLAVSLGNISPEYYHYLDKRNNSFFTIDLVSEPFNLPSNINGGYGYFEMYIPDNRLLVMNTEKD